MNVIYILWVREIKRYFRSKARILGSLGQPLLFLIALGFGFGPIFEKAMGVNYIQFLTPGIICMEVLFTAVFSGSEIIVDKQFGFLRETLVAPVSRFKIMLGRTLGDATVATIQGLIILILSFFVGFHLNNWFLLPIAVIFIFLTALLFTALGTAVASIMEDVEGFYLVINVLVMPLFFLSGSLFPLLGAPKFLSIIAKADPLTYGIDALRGTMVGIWHIGLMTDISVLVGITALFMLVGSYLFSKIEI